MIRAILERRGQVAFRDSLLLAYGRMCAITGCDAAEALEAAHVVPVSEGGSFKVSNGLLLRADIHTLFDLHFIGINPETTAVVLAPTLRGTSYQTLAGSVLRLPLTRAVAPRVELLRRRWAQFLAVSEE